MSYFEMGRDFLEVQWLRLHFPPGECRVRSLVRELRSHMPLGQKTNIKQLNIANKFKQTLKINLKIKTEVDMPSGDRGTISVDRAQDGINSRKKYQ